MQDETEAFRRARVAELNEQAAERKSLEERYGVTWNTEELTKEFEVLGFLAPFVVAKRRSDGKKGSLEFQHHPRYYFNWQPDDR